MKTDREVIPGETVRDKEGRLYKVLSVERTVYLTYPPSFSDVLGLVVKEVVRGD